MQKKSSTPIPIGNLQLAVGVFVWLDLPWSAHPFFYNKFRIVTEEQLKQVKALGIENIYWIPAKSTVEPTAAREQTSEPAPPAAAQDVAQANSARLNEKNERIERQRALKNKAERNWEKAASATKEAILGLRDNPKQAGPRMREVCKSAVTSIIGAEPLLLLLGDKQGDGPQYHALNCMTLSMLVARQLNLPAPAIEEVALGALSHDAGKTMIPAHIIRSDKRSKHEESMYRDHCSNGAYLVRISGSYSEAAISAIEDHHERLDGSGYPSGKSGASIGLSARIVAVVDYYDELCSPEAVGKIPMLPSDALKQMWRLEQSRLDLKIITALVKLLGVYPPGTIVSLNDGSMGLVVSPGKQSLLPKVLIYDADIPKDEAIVMDLAESPGITIESALKPEDISEDAFKWFNPREKLSYYFTAESSN